MSQATREGSGRAVDGRGVDAKQWTGGSYSRALRLRRVSPGQVLRVLLVEGLIGCALLLVLAGAASAWALLVLPVTGAVVVKAHDVLAAALGSG